MLVVAGLLKARPPVNEEEGAVDVMPSEKPPAVEVAAGAELLNENPEPERTKQYPFSTFITYLY